MRLTERCSCGASIDVKHEQYEGAMEAIRDWRENHNHTPPRTGQPGITTINESGVVARARTFPGMTVPADEGN